MGGVLGIFLIYKIPIWTDLGFWFSILLVLVLAVFFIFYVLIPHLIPAMRKVNDGPMGRLEDRDLESWTKKHVPRRTRD